MKLNYKINTLTLLFSLLVLLTKGQITRKEFSALSGYHFASNNVWETRQSLNGIPIGFDYSIGKTGIGSNAYKKIYGAQKAMLNFRVIKMNNTDTFGYCLAVLPSVNIPLFTNDKHTISAKVAYGINFNTKLFREETNFDNRAISSPINFGFDLAAEYEYQTASKRYYHLSTGLYHVSNGSLHMPNGGINIIYLKAGIGLNQTPEKAIETSHYKLETQKWRYWNYGFAAYKQMDYFSDMKEFWVFGFNQHLNYRINHLYSIGLGADVFYDATQSLIIEPGKNVYEVMENEKYFLALGLSQRFDLGKLFLPFGIYTYAAPLKEVKERIYIRFGLGYQFSKNWFIGSFFKGTINANGQLKSDFMEWSIGYSLPNAIFGNNR